MALLSTPLKSRVQSILAESGAPPQAELTRNYDQICVVMQRRREDDAFWARLTELVRDLVDSVVKSKNPHAPLPPEAKFLALWDVNELAQLLRAALSQEPPTQAGATEADSGAGWLRHSRGLSPNTLGFLLLLSLAASACGGSDSHNGANGTGTTGGTVGTGGANVSLTTAAKTGLGGATSTATSGASHSGGMSGLGGNGGTASNAGGSAAVGGAALGGTAATGGASVSLTATGNTGTGGGSSAITGGASPTGGTQALGSNGGTPTGGTQALGGNGGTAGSTGGQTATGGAALTCDKDGGAAGATSVVGHALPPDCCVDTASALWNAINKSTLDSSQKQSLYTCFANLNATWCDGLVDLFKNATSDVIAQYLNDLLTCCSALPSSLTGDFAAVRQDVINRMLCSVVLYKGVTFPS